jgi:hypothetical protein
MLTRAVAECVTCAQLFWCNTSCTNVMSMPACVLHQEMPAHKPPPKQAYSLHATCGGCNGCNGQRGGRNAFPATRRRTQTCDVKTAGTRPDEAPPTGSRDGGEQRTLCASRLSRRLR